jgi:drug/metabolite transporter (DMT)-like permease
LRVTQTVPKNRDKKRKEAKTLLTKRGCEPADARGVSRGEPDQGERNTTPFFEATLLSTALLLGTNPAAVKYAVGFVPPLPFAALRFILAGLVLLAVLRLFGSEGGIGRRDLLALAGVGVVGVALNNATFTYGVSMTSASDTALIVATAPLWGMLLGFVLGLERPKLKGLVGVGLALFGVGMIVYQGLGASGTSLTGDLLVMGAAACWGSYAVLSLPLLKRYSPLVVAAYTMLFGGLAVLPFASFGLLNTDWEAVSAGGWAAAAYSALLVAAFGFTSWQRGVARIGANRMLVYQYLVTLTGVLAGVVLFHEDFGLDKALGTAILLSGVYLARRQ